MEEMKKIMKNKFKKDAKLEKGVKLEKDVKSEKSVSEKDVSEKGVKEASDFMSSIITFGIIKSNFVMKLTNKDDKGTPRSLTARFSQVISSNKCLYFVFVENKEGLSLWEHTLQSSTNTVKKVFSNITAENFNGAIQVLFQSTQDGIVFLMMPNEKFMNLLERLKFKNLPPETTPTDPDSPKSEDGEGWDGDPNVLARHNIIVEVTQKYKDVDACIPLMKLYQAILDAGIKPNANDITTFFSKSKFILEDILPTVIVDIVKEYLAYNEELVDQIQELIDPKAGYPDTVLLGKPGL